MRMAALVQRGWVLRSPDGWQRSVDDGVRFLGRAECYASMAAGGEQRILSASARWTWTRSTSAGGERPDSRGEESSWRGLGWRIENRDTCKPPADLHMMRKVARPNYPCLHASLFLTTAGLPITVGSYCRRSLGLGT